MPIFDNNGKKQNVQDAHVEKYMELYPDATTVMERDGKKYRVKAKDYNTFLGDTLEAPKMESAPQPAPQVEAEPQQKAYAQAAQPVADELGIAEGKGKVEAEPTSVTTATAEVVAPVKTEASAAVPGERAWWQNAAKIMGKEEAKPQMYGPMTKELMEEQQMLVEERSIPQTDIEAAMPQANASMLQKMHEGATMQGAFDRAYGAAKGVYFADEAERLTKGLLDEYSAERAKRLSQVEKDVENYNSARRWAVSNPYATDAYSEVAYRGNATKLRNADELGMMEEFAKDAKKRILADENLKAKAEENAELLGMPVEKYINEVAVPIMQERMYSEWLAPQEERAKRNYNGFAAAAEGSLIGTLLGATRTDTEKYLSQVGQEAWRENASLLGRAAAGAGSMFLDLPAFGGIGALASVPAKAVGGQVFKQLAKNETKRLVARGVAEGAAQRYANYAVRNGLKNRILLNLSTAPLQSGLTFGMFDAGKAALNMSLNGEWDWKELGKSAVGGTLMGGALGATGAVGGGLTHGLTGATQAAAKVAEFGVENAVFTEGGRLIGKLHGQQPENGWLEDYVESGATLLIIKAPNIVKNVSAIKGDKEASEVFAFNRLEREQLGKYGEDLNALLESLLPKSGRLYEDRLKINEGTFTEEYRRVMSDPEVSMTTKAKLMGIVEGKMMPAPRVVDAKIEGNRVMTYDPMGRLVEVKEYATEAKANAEYKKVANAAEVESIAVLEDVYMRIKGYEADELTVKEWLAKNPKVTMERVAEIVAKNSTGEKLTEAEQKILESLRQARREGLNDVRHLNDVLAGLDVDAKDVMSGIEKPIDERTEAENRAVKAYTDVLYQEIKAKVVEPFRRGEARRAEDVDTTVRLIESDRSVDETANDGMVYTTTTPSGEKIIITGGKVVLDNEGYIDVNQSEGLVAMFPDGQKKPVRPGDLREKVEVSNAEEMKAVKREEIEQEIAAENGWKPIEVGAEYDVVFDGDAFRVKVEGRDENGDVIISGEGASMAVPESFLQDAMKQAEAVGEMPIATEPVVAPVESTVPTSEEVADAQAFADAYAANTMDAYQNYLDKFPEGAYREGARRGIWALEGTSSVADIASITNAENVLQRAAANEVQPEVAPVVEGQKGENAEKVVEPVDEAAAPVVEAPKTALEQIPRNEKNVPLYEQVDSELAWDGVVEEAGGNEEIAMLAVNSMIADKQDALKKAEKAKAKAGATITEKIAAENERVANIEKAKADLAKWEEIAGVKAKRALAAEAESKRVADEAAAKQRAEEERLRVEREEAEREEREALNGVPDMVDDKPQDARARGYRRVNGHKVDRQEPVQGLMGKEIAVKFSDSSIPTGRVAVIEAEQLQPSHIQGQRNPLHFIDEAQPKERNDAASVLSARKIAENVRPEEITSSVTAYTGAPTVNARGEAVQGNNRSAALRLMWENNPEQAAKYKQYLMDHAAEFGLNAEEIAAMKSPVLVNMLDVSDADAITLGQYVAQDTESGGTERIKPKNVMQKMGGDMRSFANKLLASNNEEASFAELVDANGVEVLKWMAQKGYITPTQYKSAFDSKGNLTAEVKNDLRDVMYQSIFKGGSTQLEEMFNALPAKAQKAILATAFRDYDSPSAERMNGEVQNSIRAYYALARDAAFANAKNYKEAKEAAMMWARQYQLDDVSGESFLPSENFSNFAIELAIVYKGWTQRNLQNHFNNIYDLVQGTKEASLFEEADNTPRTLKEAIKETFNIDYNGQSNSNSLAIDSKDGQARKRGGNGDIATGERIEGGERPADSTGGTRGNGEVSSPEIPNNQTRDNVSPVEGVAEGEVKTESGEVKTENAPSEADAPGQSGVDASESPMYTLGQLDDVKAQLGKLDATTAPAFAKRLFSIRAWNTLEEAGNALQELLASYGDTLHGESTAILPFLDEAQKLIKAAVKEPTFTEEVLENGDKRITNYNSRGEIKTVATERDGKIVSVDSYDEGVLFETTTYDENGVATSVIRYDKSGNVVAKQEFKPTAKAASGVAATLIKGAKWENTGEPDKIKSSRKKGDSHDITWYIGKKKYGSTTAERDLLVVLAEDYRGDLNAVWNAYEQGKVLLGANEAAILKKLIETNTSAAELQQGVLELDRENPAFERATENVRKKLEATGVKVKVLTKEEAESELARLEELADMQKRTAPETASVQDEHQPTVVSSADGAKVLKDLDNAIKEYENKSSHPKTLLGDVARVLNAKKHGSNSQYATFEAVNGKVFTIRLANHNAKVSTFDNHDENEGISIVVTAQDNNGIINDGNAHLVEFFYDAIKLRKADGKPLVEILKSIKQALYSGEYKDNTGLAQPEEVNIPEFMKVLNENAKKTGLIGTHSLTEEKLRKAIKMGGLANPSTAIFEMGEEMPGEYGEITFVMPSSMVDKKTGRNTGAFAGDAWTPTYPQVERQMSKRGGYRAREDVQSVPKEMQKEVKMGLDSWLDGREGAGLAYMFLQEEGMAPELSRVAQKYPDEIRNRVSEIAQGEPFYRLSPEQKQQIVDLFVEQHFNGDMDYYSGYLKEKVAMMQDKIADENTKSFIKKSIQQYIDGVNEYGYEYEAVSDFLNKVQRDINHSGAVNDMATTQEAARIIREQGLEKEFQEWKEELVDRYEIKEVIFKGFTPTGNRKYVPHTLENVSKDMKEQGRNGAVGLNASFSKFAAGLLKPLGSLDAIRKRKGNLRPTHADTEAFKNKWSEVYYDLAEKLQPDAKGYEDYGLDRVAEAATKKDPKAFIKSEYGIELSEADEKALKDMIWAIQNEYPVMYFETKFERPVYLDEFAGVALPENVDKDIVEALNNAGVKIETYDPGNEKARMDAVKRLVAADNRIEFLRTSDGTTYGWAVNGEIYLTPEGLNPNTPIHEYTHLWAAALQKSNPKLWGEVVEAMKLSPAWNEVMADENYTDIHGDDNRVASEVLSRLSGNEGYRRYMEQAEAEIAAERNIGEKVRKKGILNRIKNAVSRFWNWLKGKLGSKAKAANEQAEEAKAEPWDVFVNKTLKDFDEGVNPDAKDSPLDRMFIGKKGAANLDKAEEATTRLDNLNVAREMEAAGKDAKAIKLATGWERGADGKWRYEVMDDFELDLDANVAYGKRNPEVIKRRNRWRELLHKGNALAFEGELLSADETAEFESLSAEFKGTQLHNSRTLKDYIDAPELFEAYPEVADINMRFEKLKNGIEGSYNAGSNMIKIADDLSKLKMKSVILHEVQHAIQYIEGFARGGNTEDVLTRAQALRGDVRPLYDMMLETPEWAEKKRLVNRWLAEEDKAEPDRDYQAQLWERIEEINNSGVLDDIQQLQDRLIKKYGLDRTVTEIISGPYAMDAEVWSNLPESFYDKYDAYKRLAGEVEARNVQERMGMTAEERRNSLAEETYMKDVAKEDQTFIFDNLGVSSSQEVAPEQDIPVGEVESKPLTFAEKITNSVLEASAKNKENLALRSDALRMFGRDVANVLKLMGKQREYDKSTVDQLVKLAKMYFKDAQLLGGLTPYQVGRVMTRLNNAVGKRDITDDANELVNILVDAHNKELEKMLEKQAKTKAKKVNASGVEVIGKLDKEGQLLLEEYNNSKVLDLKSIDDKIIDLQNEAAEASGKLEGANGEVERETAAKIRGLELARQYREEILAKQTEIKGLEQELKSAEQDAKDGAMDRAAYKEFRRATERAILESKLEMVDAYHGLIHGLGGDISSSAKRAKLFQQQQIDHVKEIQHNANSDLLGHPAEAQGETPDKWNSSVPRLFMSAMPTFQTMLKFFGEKAADGRGYLYERFIPQHTQASHNEYVGKTEAREKMRDKLTEIFGKKTTIENFMDMSRKEGAVLEYQEGGQKKTIDLTRGQVLYLYMINKMADGQMKLSRMGITDADVQKMAKELPEEMVRFADWVQEEFLTELRDKYNAVHERMFGAPMAAIESYFPIKINKRSRGEKIEPGMNAEDKPSTVTGSVIKRTKNAVAIDLSADAMQVLLGHIDDMENWAAWAEFRRDLKSLLNYRHFQNQVKGMESLRYGSGEKLWKNFVDVANIAAGSFKPSSTAADRAVRNIAKGVVSSKIAFRYFTAVKQILSTPAFWSEVDFGKMMNAYLHQKEAWDWAMKNLPGFSKRWEGRASGNEILLESDADWKVWQNRAVQWLSKEGMRANAFIDALTVATGAKAVFETKYEMFKKAGYSEERAREKALNRAAEAYNESQQSSESAYLSPLQAEATFVSSVLTAYRNSPFGYNRKMATAIANLKKKMKKGFKQESIEYMIKQLMRDGLNEEQAKKFAKSTYRRSVARDAADVALYEFFLNYVWVLGPSLIYILGGDDDEKKKELNVEALIDGAMGGLGNLPAGETLTGAIKAIAEGDVSNFKLPQAVAMQDMETIADLMQTDPVRAAGEVLNILVAMGVGVNPQTFTDMFVALADTEDWSDPREIAMLVLRLINAPNSKLELLEADEAMENYGANIEEITREYAEYQKSKRAPLTGWLYSDESEQKAIERYEKRFKKILDERFEVVVENTDEYDMWYENSDPQMKAKLAKLRQKFLEGDKETTMEKLDSIDVTKKVLFGSGYDEVNTVYYELSTAEDEDMAMMIDTKLKELTPMMDEYKKLRGDERKAYREENLEQIQFYNRLNAHKNNVNNLKGAMKKKPEEAQEKMEKIRKIRTKAIDLINNYNE